jgi:LPS-assembly lipoprotein
MSGAARSITLFYALLSALFGAALLSGCGWQLRGAVDVPPQLSPVFVRGGGLVGRSINTRLSGGDVPVTSNAAEAGLLIEVLSENRSSRVVAVDVDGKALAYELLYRVRVKATDRAGRVLVPAQQLSVERTFDDNPDVSVLGKQLEQDIIYGDLADAVADQFLLRLRAALANWRPAPPDAPGAATP